MGPLRLYITGQTPRSAASIRNLREVCDEFLEGRFELQIIDLYQRPELAKEAQVVAAPTHDQKASLLPLRRLVGDLSNKNEVLLGLDLKGVAMGTTRPSKARILGSEKNQEAPHAGLAELEETFLSDQARGRVDAVVVGGPDGDQVFTLQGAEHPYRVLVETMKREGAATLDQDGAVLYANASFARILGVALEDTIGTRLETHFAVQEQKKKKNLAALIANGLSRRVSWRSESCGFRWWPASRASSSDESRP